MNQKVDEVLNCDVVTVGIGAAGMTAAVKAAKDGAKVVGIDRAQDFTEMNNVYSTAALAVETEDEKKYPDYMTVGEAFRYIWEENNYQANGRFTLNALKATGKAIDLLKDGGVTFIPTYTDARPNDNITKRTGNIYKESGPKRAAQFQKLVDQAGVKQLWSTKVVKILSNDPEVTGVIAKRDNGQLVQVNAKGGVIICGGGFLHNDQMIQRYYGIPKVYGYANAFVDGSGIKLAQEAGAQMGKNFTIAMNEGGGVNHKSATFMKTLWGDNSLFRIALLGGVIVNNHGLRFVDEAELCKRTMYNSEPLIREGGKFYSVVDQGTLDILKTMTLDQYTQKYLKTKVTAPMFVMAFANQILKNVDQDIKKAESEGWCWQADTLEELDQKSHLTNLSKEIQHYNQMCQQGEDTELFKDPNFLNPINKGPFYVIENDFSGWVTQGGVKTNGVCCALNKFNQVINGLFIAGADGDFWGVPYLVGGTANGFSLASGYIAGTQCYQRALDKAKYDQEMKANDQYSTDNSSTNEWKDGTYNTIAHGRNADFDIEVGIKDHQIKQIKISDHNSESKGIGSKAVAELPSRIIKAQSTNVDAISGATVTSNAIKYAIRDVLDKNRD